MLVVKRKVIFITCLSLLLTSFQITNNQYAVAAICGGHAAYPPDLPDCLDPVVEEQRVAAAEAAARASASAAATRAAADAAAPALPSCSAAVRNSRTGTLAVNTPAELTPLSHTEPKSFHQS